MPLFLVPFFICHSHCVLHCIYSIFQWLVHLSFLPTTSPFLLKAGTAACFEISGPTWLCKLWNSPSLASRAYMLWLSKYTTHQYSYQLQRCQYSYQHILQISAWALSPINTHAWNQSPLPSNELRPGVFPDVGLLLLRSEPCHLFVCLNT